MLLRWPTFVLVFGVLSGLSWAQDGVKTAAKLRRLDLTTVPLAHGRNSVRKKNSAFEEIEFSEKLDAAQGEKPFVQISEAKIESPKTSLFRDMMNGEHARKRQMVRAHVNRHERGRPIVQMQNLRRRS